jgi:hypothetical protein
MSKYIFIIAFIVSSVFQGVSWVEFGIVDGGLWASQAQYVQTHDTREFNFLGAYGHPGGTIVEGTALIHDVFKIDYYNSLITFLVIFDSIIISSICVLSYKLRKRHIWWIITLATLSLDRLYDSLTPASVVATLLFVFLSLLTLYLYENEITKKKIIIWSLIAGMLIATRIDIGCVSTVAFIVLLVQKLKWKDMLSVLTGIILSFCIFDPFMWFMPIQHLRDLIFKITYHYSDIAATHMTFISLLSFSSIAFISMILSIILLILQKKKKVIAPIPPAYTYTLLVLSGILYTVYLTAHEQTTRYFVPLVFIWEVFLPLFIFCLIPLVDFNFLKNKVQKNKGGKIGELFVALILIAYPIIFFINSLSIGFTFNLSKW